MGISLGGGYLTVRDLFSEETFYDDYAYAPQLDQEYQKIQPIPQPVNPQVLGIQEGVRLPIIMYHYVDYATSDEDKGRRSLTVAPSTLETAIKHLLDEHVELVYVRDLPTLVKQPAKGKVLALTFDDGYEDFYTSVLPILKKYHVKATLYIINNYIGRKGFLNTAEINEIVESGLVEIGAHTMDHAYLKTMSPKAATAEIVESKRLLEEQFGVEVSTFAYPYGAFNPQTPELVKEASFSAAVSTEPGFMQSQKDIYTLYRIRAGAFVGSNIDKILDGTYKIK